MDLSAVPDLLHGDVLFIFVKYLECTFAQSRGHNGTNNIVLARFVHLDGRSERILNVVDFQVAFKPLGAVLVNIFLGIGF